MEVSKAHRILGNAAHRLNAARIGYPLIPFVHLGSLSTLPNVDPKTDSLALFASFGFDKN